VKENNSASKNKHMTKALSSEQEEEYFFKLVSSEFDDEDTKRILLLYNQAKQKVPSDKNSNTEDSCDIQQPSQENQQNKEQEDKLFYGNPKDFEHITVEEFTKYLKECAKLQGESNKPLVVDAKYLKMASKGEEKDELCSRCSARFKDCMVIRIKD
jgi:hypothetical protein